MTTSLMHLRQGDLNFYFDPRNVVLVESAYEDSDDYCAYLSIVLSTGHEILLFEPVAGKEDVGKPLLLVVDYLKTKNHGQIDLPPEMTVDVQYPKHFVRTEHLGEGVSSNDTRSPGRV